MASTAQQAPMGRSQILAGFSPVSTLWEGDDPPYPSEQSARWALRKLRRELADASAIAVHRRLLFVQVSKFLAVAEREALDAYRRRVAPAQ